MWEFLGFGRVMKAAAIWSGNVGYVWRLLGMSEPVVVLGCSGGGLMGEI